MKAKEIIDALVGAQVHKAYMDKTKMFITGVPERIFDAGPISKLAWLYKIVNVERMDSNKIYIDVFAPGNKEKDPMSLKEFAEKCKQIGIKTEDNVKMAGANALTLRIVKAKFFYNEKTKENGIAILISPGSIQGNMTHKDFFESETPNPRYIEIDKDSPEGKQIVRARSRIAKFNGKFYYVDDFGRWPSDPVILKNRPFDTKIEAQDYLDYLNSHGDY